MINAEEMFVQANFAIIFPIFQDFAYFMRLFQIFTKIWQFFLWSKLQKLCIGRLGFEPSSPI